MLGIVEPPKGTLIPQGTVAPIIRLQAEGRPRPIRRRGIPLPRATQAGNIRCFYCKKLRHRKDQCPQLVGSNSEPPNNHGSTARSPKSTQGPQASQ
jgi:hypothetical protein